MTDFLHTAGMLRLFDGSKGVMLQREGLAGHEAAEEWNRSHPDKVQAVYDAYIAAGSDIIQTNTFPGNGITLAKHGLGDAVYDLNFAGVSLAKDAASHTERKVLVAAAVGPTGEFLEPAGPLSFEAAVDAFRVQMRAMIAAGADLVCFETFTDLQELRAAVLALKDAGGLPFVTSLSFEGAGRTLSGNPAECCAVTFQSMGAALVGANCSGGPDSLKEPIRRMHTVASVPLTVKPNAGLPHMVDGVSVYDEKPQDFNAYVEEYLQNGVRLIGGCCGATPAHIAAIGKKLSQVSPGELSLKDNDKLCSAYLLASAADLEVISAEPFREALLDGDCGDLCDEILDLEADAVLLDFGTKAWDSIDVWDLISNLCLTVKTPLAIKSADEALCTAFLRYYPGRAGVIAAGNKAVEEAAEKYGALVLQ